MDTIKAIETRYKGYRFRSRLEARWAVFFDALGLKWEYEREGFNLGDLGWYLPDFWLPQVEMWGEVKPLKHEPKDLAKCMVLARYGYPVLLLSGTPENKPYVALIDPEIRGIDDNFDCQLFAFTMEHGYPIDEHRLYSCIDDDDQFDDVGRAAYAARSARFEHGKSRQ